MTSRGTSRRWLAEGKVGIFLPYSFHFHTTSVATTMPTHSDNSLCSTVSAHWVSILSLPPPNPQPFSPGCEDDFLLSAPEPSTLPSFMHFLPLDCSLHIPGFAFWKSPHLHHLQLCFLQRPLYVYQYSSRPTCMEFLKKSMNLSSFLWLGFLLLQIIFHSPILSYK